MQNPRGGEQRLDTLTVTPPTAGESVAEADGLRMSIVRSWSDAAALRGEWNGLLSRARGNSIFLTGEWIQSWLDVGRAAA